MNNAHTKRPAPDVCYQEAEIQPESESKVDAAFDLLFEAMVEAGFSYPQSARIPQLTAMHN